MAGLAQTEEPLSAIDWLSQSVTPMAAGQADAVPPIISEPPITGVSALPDDVAVSIIGAPSPDAVGLLPPAVTGFPRDLWGLGKLDEVTTAIRSARTDGLPALQSLLITLLLAEAQPPADAGDAGVLLNTRIDKLLEVGALDQVQALIAVAGPTANPEIFRRAFDVALLTGSEDAACHLLVNAPELSPALTTRVFCLARAGDWNAAALTLRTAQALGHVSGVEEILLSRFLDPDLYEDEDVPRPPKPITPLIWRIYEAIGEPLSTTTLPLAFAYAELSVRAGWKARLEAAERLARAGVLSPNVLLGFYTERDPAASGGVWDRADAFQRFDAALRAGNQGAVEQRLPLAYARMADVETEVPFATLFATALSKMPLTGDAARIAFKLGLLSPDYQRLAKSPLAPPDATTRFLQGLAAGSVDGTVPPDNMGRAIAPAFLSPVIPESAQLLLDQNRKGEAILLAIFLIESGVQGEMTKVPQGLALLRKLGLEDVARRTAIELMLLERRG